MIKEWNEEHKENLFKSYFSDGFYVAFILQRWEESQ